VSRRRSTWCAELTAAFVLALPALGVAQSMAAAPVLVTDRPGFGESSAVVERGTIQIESGITVQQSSPSIREVSAPQVLARIGVTPRVELRVATDGLIADSVRTPHGPVHTHGGSDSELGGKVKLFDAARAGIDLALIPYLSLPTASRGFGSDHVDPGFKVAAARDLPHGFGLSGTFNAADVSGDGRRAWQRELSVSLDHGVGVGAGVGAFGEVDSAFTGSGCDCSVDAGITVALGTNGQVDVEAGRGLHGAAQDWFVGAGFVVRHRHR
jgi:hypothetical protein